ncbi:MAG: protein jag [Oscillospiraceae bacterium]|nr:protein jag [Oscillospiraceae bacterium]
MEKFITATGKTIDLAIEAALQQLQMDRDSVSVEVLENPKSGFLGLGAVPAKVKVTYEVPDEAPKPALSSASRSKPKKAAAPKQEEVKPINPVQPKKEAAKQETPKQEKKPAEPKVVREYAPAAEGSMEEKIEIFIKGLLEHMGSDAVPHAWKEDDTYRVDLVGEHLGMLIGRRGETLDAIQHLTNYSINRDNSKRTRINVDAECYREKREESLKRLAMKVAGKVVKYRRNITLEPMNAYERHVIHATLQDVPDVTTYSTGSEPNRRVVVSYSKYSD